jgi:hypothetical protein
MIPVKIDVCLCHWHRERCAEADAHTVNVFKLNVRLHESARITPERCHDFRTGQPIILRQLLPHWRLDVAPGALTTPDGGWLVSGHGNPTLAAYPHGCVYRAPMTVMAAHITPSGRLSVDPKAGSHVCQLLLFLLVKLVATRTCYQHICLPLALYSRC